MTPLLGAIEAGGTKFRAAVFTHDLELVDEVRVPTTAPTETLSAMIDFLAGHELRSLGIASFGPLILDSESPDVGSFGPTPKPGWSGAPLVAPFRDALGVPVGLETDVEAAAAAEQRMGAAVGMSRVAYATIGTGIGASVAVDGAPVRGRNHAELGHIPVKRHPDDSFVGRCPFHGDCLEGMASGPAIADRWEADPASLDNRAEVWEMEAFYIAQLARVLAYSVAPDVFLIGGGVGTRPGMAEMVEDASLADMNGYAEIRRPGKGAFVRAAGLGVDAGLFGAAIIAERLAE